MARELVFFYAQKEKTMAKATYRTVIDGQVYNVGDDLPEYGSLRIVTLKDGRAEIEGNSSDVAKLPTWVKQGSQAYFVDNQKVYKFDEANTQWVEQ